MSLSSSPRITFTLSPLLGTTGARWSAAMLTVLASTTIDKEETKQIASRVTLVFCTYHWEINYIIIIASHLSSSWRKTEHMPGVTPRTTPICPHRPVSS